MKALKLFFKSGILSFILFFGFAVKAGPIVNPSSCRSETEMQKGVDKLLVDLYCNNPGGNGVSCYSFNRTMYANNLLLTSDQRRSLRLLFLGQFLKEAARKGQLSYAATEFASEIAEFGIQNIKDSMEEKAVSTIIQLAIKQIPGVAADLAEKAGASLVGGAFFVVGVVDNMLNFGLPHHNLCIEQNLISELQENNCHMAVSYNPTFVKFLIKPVAEQMQLLNTERYEDGNNCQLFQMMSEHPPAQHPVVF